MESLKFCVATRLAVFRYGFGHAPSDAVYSLGVVRRVIINLTVLSVSANKHAYPR